MKKKNSSVLKLKDAFKKKDKLSKIYSIFKSHLNKTIKDAPFLVAVSGGPDSLALTALSQMYKIERKNKVFYVLVDHKIRKNSSSEAKTIKIFLKTFNIQLNIISNTKKIEKNIQSSAREVRYDLLSDFCKKKSTKFILTGHHSDDQVETFLIRLSRGSGVQGLSSMDQISRLKDNIKLFRPLLDYKKKDLKYIAKSIFKKSFKDPSNKDNKYLRTRIRGLGKQLEISGIHHDQIIQSIKNLTISRNTLNNYLFKVTKNCVRRKKNEILIDFRILDKEPDEIAQKIISYEIKHFVKSYYPPRSKKVQNLLNLTKKNAQIKLTLGGCIIEKSSNLISIKREKKQ
jgi:tRNA(Ile)-lysidine synthase